MRLHLLAAYLAKEGAAERVEVVVVHFEGNDSLLAAPPELQDLDRDMGLAWRRLLRSPENFRSCSAEGVAASIGGVDLALYAYLSE
jgi:hypothetical protein